MADQAGYPEKPLIEKLGYAPHDAVFVQGAPAWFMDMLRQHSVVTPEDLLYFESFTKAGESPTVHSEKLWLHGFFQYKADLDAADFLNTVFYTGWHWDGIWVSWPKKAAQKTLPSDLDEQHFRDILLPLGWVDTKVCAIDGVWSGLKFLPRKNTAPAS